MVRCDTQSVTFDPDTLGTHDRIYLAGRFDRKDELRGYADQLTALDYEVTSRWLYGTHECDGDCDPEELARFAAEDIEDIKRSQALMCFTEDPATTGYQSGGRHVEWGIALASGMDVAIVGPAENVFHHLSYVMQFDSFEDILTLRSKQRALAVAEGHWPEDRP